jgi:hypothetical protein
MVLVKTYRRKQGKIVYAGDFIQNRSDGIDIMSWRDMQLFD